MAKRTPKVDWDALREKVDWDALREKVKSTDKAILRAVASDCDGHTIYLPQHFIEKGLDAAVVAAFDRVHESTGGKGDITSGGRKVKVLQGVYGLEILEFICGVFAIDSWKMGRGSRAVDLAEQLIAAPDAR
jgi:hypothetical protein